MSYIQATKMLADELNISLSITTEILLQLTNTNKINNTNDKNN